MMMVTPPPPAECDGRPWVAVGYDVEGGPPRALVFYIDRQRGEIELDRDAFGQLAREILKGLEVVDGAPTES